MSVNPRIPVASRARIISRINGGTSVVTVSALQDANDLAYAIRFLTDHFVYKRSKTSNGVNTNAGQEALQAVKAAAETFANEVMGAKTQDTIPPVSPLAVGKIGNPYDYAGNGTV